MLKQIISKIAVVCILAFTAGANSYAANMKVSYGKMTVYEQFKSEFIESRKIYVWTPEDYNTKEKYAVLYMHDGQMLWDSTATWNKQEWMIDEIASLLMKENKTRKFIVVGISNHQFGERFHEYCPAGLLDYIDAETLTKAGERKDQYIADNYLKFLVKELKPFIDRNYSTIKGTKGTFIMGSSMGGLISLYAICEYPEVFGGAGCISTHFCIVDEEEWLTSGKDTWAASFRAYLEDHLPKANSRIIYMDRGDQTLDASYPYFQNEIDKLMTKKGWKLPYWTSKVFPDASHQERDWARRVATPMQFLLSDKENEKVNRIDPPMWWAGMKESELQLMVYGNNIGSYTPEIDYPDVKIREVVSCESANYLIMYLDVKDAKPGKFNIHFNGRKNKIDYEYELRQRDIHAAEIKGFTSEDVLYLVMPDRFANGDKSNDNYPVRFPDPVDRLQVNGRHGGDFAGIEQHIDYLEDLNITALWLNPVLENDMPKYCYHGYATTDYYRIDPRFGTNDDYKHLSDELHKRDIKLVMDMIFNHCGSNHVWLADKPMRSWFNNPYEYVETNHDKAVFYDPHASKIDQITMTDGWFVPTMPDLNQRNRHVEKYLIQNSIWWIEYVHLNGIRMDTYPYADKEMMERWCTAVYNEYPDFNIVGESWIHHPVGTAYWQRGNRINPSATLKTTMDFPLQDIATKAFAAESGYQTGMDEIFQHMVFDFCYPDIKNVLRFFENHDTHRFFVKDQKNADIFKQSMVFLMTIPGIPQIYYGQELMRGGNGKKYQGIRPDMEGGWEEDPTSVFDGTSLNNLEKESLAFTQKLLKWRKGNKVISEGNMKHYQPYNKSIYVYARQLGKVSYIIILNGSDEVRTLNLDNYSEILRGYRKGVDVLTESTIELTEKVDMAPRGVLLIELK